MRSFRITGARENSSGNQGTSLIHFLLYPPPPPPTLPSYKIANQHIVLAFANRRTSFSLKAHPRFHARDVAKDVALQDNL